MFKKGIVLIALLAASASLMAQVVEPVVWTDLVGDVTVSGTYSNTITKNTGSWWNVGAASSNVIRSNEDGYAEFTVQSTSHNLMFGLSTTNADALHTSIQYNIYTKANGTIDILRPGSSTQGSVSSYAIGDVIRITRTGTSISFSKNGIPIGSSLSCAASDQFLVDICMYSAGGAFGEAMIYSNGSTHADPTSYWVKNGSDLFSTPDVSGNVGIGVAAPTEKLDVLGSIQITSELKSTDHMKLIPAAGKWIEFKPTHVGHGIVLRSPSAIRFASIMMSDNNEFRIGRNGNGPIDYNIKINQDGYVDLHSNNTDYGVVIRSPDAVMMTNLLTDNTGHFYIGQTADPYIFINSNGAASNPSFVGIGNMNPSERLDVTGNIKADGLRINTTVTSGGYIAIGGVDGTGTTTPYDMVVNGHLGVHKLKVDINDAWGDFVFGEGYQLMSLEELEVFVNENNHLPEIPTAEEIESEGVDMGEIVRQQMIKIEELTLHLIELNKKVEELSK